VDDLKKMLKEGLIAKENSTRLISSEQKPIRGKKVYKKNRKKPATIDYNEITTIWVNNYCDPNSKSILLTKSICGDATTPPYTFFLICVPEDQFDNMLAAFVYLLPHAVVKEKKPVLTQTMQKENNFPLPSFIICD
jgi:hypothetical protein